MQCGQLGILQSCGFLVLSAELSLLNVARHLLDIGFELLYVLGGVLFGFPASLHFVELFLLVGKLFCQLCKSVLRELIVFLFERHFLDFELHDVASQVVKLARHGVDFRSYHGARFIHKVYSLIGEETVCDVTVRQNCGGYKRVIVNSYAVEYLVSLFKSAENGDCVFNRRLVYHNRLETSFKRCVLFDVLSVFVERGRADAVQLTSCKHRL